MMASYANGLEFAKPTPAHALTPAAEAARVAVRRAGFEKRMKRTADEIVVEHGNPKPKPYDGPSITASARALAAKAERAGFTVTIVELLTGCRVEGRHDERGVAFRAYWDRGSTTGGTWHEARDRYVLADDARPEGVNKLTRTGIKGKRPPGLGRVHLKLVGSIAGIPFNVTDIERMIAS